MDKVVKIIQRMNSARFGVIRKAWHLWLRTIYSCDIMPGLKIGSNCKFAHRGLGVIINPKAIIGDNVTIGGGVVIGGRGEGSGAPVIKDDVSIGAHALLLGGITIGSGATIGGGAVVVKDIPENATVVGNPARIIEH